MKLDRNSNVLWRYGGRAHHDIFLPGDGSIYILTREERRIPEVNDKEPVLEDFVVVLGPDGTERRKVSVYRAVKDSPYATLLEGMRRKGDLFHTNSVEMLDGRFPQGAPGFARGRVLVSIHSLHTIGVIDLDTARMTWALTGSWRFQHQPTLLDNGHILLFDNLGSPGRSSVLEIDPRTERVDWTYQADKSEEFSTFSCGTAQRLPNGNTLITESDNGRASEVTRQKETVWEYPNPQRAGPQKELIATLFEVVRLPSDFAAGWLGKPASGL